MRVAVLLLVLVMLTACSDDHTQTSELTAQNSPLTTENSHLEANTMGDVLFIIAQKDFRDEELETPKGILEGKGHKCEVASITTNPAKGMLGAIVKPDIAVKDVNVNNYKLVVVVGGAGSPTLMNYPEVLNVVRGAKKIAGICLGPMALAKAGVLNGKKATVFETAESKKLFRENGAIFSGEDVVVDGNIVTANGPNAAEEFGQALVELLK